MARRPRLLGSIVCALVGTFAGAAFAVATPSCTVFSGIVFDAGTGDGGNASSSSSSGTGGSAGGGGLHYLSMENAAKLCSRLSECPEPELLEGLIDGTGVPLDTANYSLCMTWAAGPIPDDRIGFKYQQTILECITNAKDCAAANACNSNEFFAGNDPRCAGKLDAGLDSGAEFCDGDNTVVRCDTGGDALHCDNPYYAKSSCLADADGTHWCASGTNCTVGAQCVGSVLDYCGSMSVLEFKIDCSTIGLGCGLDAKTDALECLTDGVYDVCPDNSSICDGTTVKSCTESVYSPFHCKALSASCYGFGGKAVCRRLGDACTPFQEGLNTCDGSIAKLCVGGQLTDFDCKSIGKSCAVSPAFGCH